MASEPLLIEEAEAVPLVAPAILSAKGRLLLLAENTGNLADAMTAEQLTTLGNEVVTDFDQDKRDRKDWEDIADEMLELASQDQPVEVKDSPWPSASNVNVPLLTIAALQFNARMYPAAIKGDEAVLCKVIGQDNGTPQKDAQGHVMPVLDQMGQIVPGPDGGPQIAWLVPPGGKAKRARRVSEYLNTVLFYRMDGWEADTDALLTQLPIVGCAFRKVWFDRGAQSAMVPAKRLVVPPNIRSLASSPRITEEVPDIFPHEIDAKMRAGTYLDVDLNISDEDQDKPRTLLEQHRWIDLDEDGHREPYIVTVDKETTQVLRVEANFRERDIVWDQAGERAIEIKPQQFYVKYGFFPHPQGKFYDIGLGHLLKRVSAVIDTSLNQMIDAGTARVAGGGFIGSGLRLQSRGGGSVVNFVPGQFKTVDMAGDDIRKAIVDRTVPDVSPVTFQILDFVMGFAKEIAGTKDILTGETAATAPVGTTLALIEQGLQVFNAVAKRYFRSARDEYQMIRSTIARHGGQAAAEDYGRVLDDAEADFTADFMDADMDIRPVSDPSAVTRMQKMAKAEYIFSKIGAIASVGGDPREALLRSLEAADVDDIDKILPPPRPTPPDPMQLEAQRLGLAKIAAAIGKDGAAMNKANAEAMETVVDAQERKYRLEKEVMTDGMRTRQNEEGAGG